MEPRGHIKVDQLGFSVLGPSGEQYPVLWSEVRRIATYKRDLLATDEIRLAFELARDPVVTQEVSEEYEGFPALFPSLTEHFGIDASWYAEVMKPAFLDNYRLLYTRPSA